MRLELSTDILPIVRPGLYGFQFWDELDEDSEDTKQAIKDGASRAGATYIQEALDVLFADVEVSNVSLVSPRYYNFADDRLDFDVTISDVDFKGILNTALDSEGFKKFLKKNYSSYDGFISHMASTVEEFNEQTEKDPQYSFAQAVTYLLGSTTLQGFNRDYWDDFVEYVYEWGEFYPEEDEGISESFSLTEADSSDVLDRKGFASLVRLYPYGYSILNDGNFVKRVYASSDDDAVSQFRDWIDEGGTHPTEYRYYCAAYFDERCAGLDDNESVTDLSSAVDWAWEHHDSYVVVKDTLTGKSVKLGEFDGYAMDIEEWLEPLYSLQESAGRKMKFKKLNEGYGGGFFITGEVYVTDISDLKFEGTKKNRYGDTVGVYSCKGKGDFQPEGMATGMTGGYLALKESYPCAFDTVLDYDLDEEFPLTERDIRGRTFRINDFVYGSGWGHVTFKGDVGDFNNPLEDYNTAIESIQLTESSDIEFLDDFVHGVVDADGFPIDEEEDSYDWDYDDEDIVDESFRKRTLREAKNPRTTYTYVVNGTEYVFECGTFSSRTGFAHKAQLTANGKLVGKATANYYNRTWEQFRYQSCMLKCLNKSDINDADRETLETAIESGKTSLKESLRRRGLTELKHTSSMSYKETDEARELYLYAENTGSLYRRMIVPVCDNLAKKYKKGTFDEEKAVDAFYYVATEASKMYKKEFGYSFSVQDRYTAAKMLLDSFMDMIKGE